MKYTIEHKTAYTVICEDSAAKALMKAINKELIRMEANRRIEFKHALKEGAREQPHRPMKKEKHNFVFDDLQAEDVCRAAQNLIGRRIRCSFFGPTLEIIPEHVEDFERLIDTL
jgi:hypothetical protein